MVLHSPSEKRLKTRILITDFEIPNFFDGNKAEAEIWDQAKFARHVRSLDFIKSIGCYEKVSMTMPAFWLRPRPLISAIILWLMCPSNSYFINEQGDQLKINPFALLIRLFKMLGELIRLPFLLYFLTFEINSLKKYFVCLKNRPTLGQGVALYLKTDLWFSTQVGGSITHMAGVVNNLHNQGFSPLVYATNPNPLLPSGIRVSKIVPDDSFWDFREIPALRFSRKICGDIKKIIAKERPSFIYQRYSLNNYAAVLLARDISVPLVTEYNGSEVWISQNWGKSPAHLNISEKIEQLNLDAADLIVVVSRVSKAELIARGIGASRILVNPNGVDPHVFHPDINSNKLRQLLGITRHSVIGFIGTFGPWHGTKELVHAFFRFLNAHPETRQQFHLLMIGDGVMREEAQQLTVKLGISEYCTFTGLIPQVEAPGYLACCDLLVAPHIPNFDGSPFFGSPTKLFEYMAMGRPIIASRLGQMEELLVHDKNAWLVEPGNIEALENAMTVLMADSKKRDILGAAARVEVLDKHTWQIHVEKIVNALKNKRSVT